MSIISLLKTEDYQESTLDAVIARHFAELQIENDLQPGMKVTIKPNLLTARRPGQAVTTHPNVVTAVVKWLKAHAIDDITIADSPAGPYNSANLRTVYSVSGMTALEGQAKLNSDFGWKEIACSEGFKSRSFNIINPIADADYIISIAKLKTHALTTLSGGIKNMFGSIPGLQKPEMHYKYPNMKDFSNMILEVALTAKPSLTLIDAVDAMEGNGPNSGDKRYLGLTLASRDVCAQDYVAAELMGIDPKEILMLELAIEKGILSPSDIIVTGDKPTPPEKPFKLPDTKRNTADFSTFLRGPILRVAELFIKPVPHLKIDKCIGCGQCAESCPPHIIQIINKKAFIPRKGCISCFCCQEVCPADAIKVKRRLG
jgi:uncharacterized protein (DUF362 family)/Pyruvate/2-oxoacid:ferredoxin oxidoreductase delta subunit